MLREIGSAGIHLQQHLRILAPSWMDLDPETEVNLSTQHRFQPSQLP